MSEPTEHGIDGAVYSLAGDGQYHPKLFCLCGYQTDRYSRDWEEAGIDMDDHLQGTPGDESTGEREGT